MRRRLSKLFDLTLALALAFVVILMLLPGGPIYERIAEWRQTRATGRALEQEWAALRSGTSVLGDPGAVDLVVFTDYECPFCRSSESVMDSFLAKHAERGILVRHLPLRGLHPSAEWAARVAICAESQNAFAHMHRTLMRSEEWRASRDWRPLISAVQIPDVHEFEQCFDSQETDERLEIDAAFARRLQLTVTPTFVAVTGLRPGGVSELADLERLLGL